MKFESAFQIWVILRGQNDVCVARSILECWLFHHVVACVGKLAILQHGSAAGFNRGTWWIIEVRITADTADLI